MYALVLVAIANAAGAGSADVDVVVLDRSAVVFARPRMDATKLGVIRKKARAQVVGTAELASSECPRWLEIAPRGWICESATSPTQERPTEAGPPSLAELEDDGEVAPIRATYGIVRRGTIAYSSKDDVVTGTGRVLAGSNTVRARGSTTIDGTRYWITTGGDLIDAKRVYSVRPSTFKGVAIVDGEMPAWTRKKEGAIEARTLVVIRETSADGRRVRVETHGETTWIARANVRVATIVEPPAGTSADERWFDVDLDQQILVAYHGARPVYATLVSTGKYGHLTPTLVARVASKHEATPMTSNKDEVYSVADVPWTMFYDGNYALHTSYWHDGFGGTRSHGCINLAPRDARLLYAWSSPDVPPGWSTVYGSEEQPGSLVRVRSAKAPAPKLRGYAKELHQQLVASRS